MLGRLFCNILLGGLKELHLSTQNWCYVNNYAIDACTSAHNQVNTTDTTALLSPTMGTPQENDAFRASFERTYKYAMESPPLSSTVVFAYRLNAVVLVGLIWYACEVVEGVSKGPPAAWYTGCR